MNNRIKELESQCWEARQYGPPWFNAEKLAELIVLECANVLDPNGEYTEKYKHSHTPGPDGLRTVLSQEQYFELLASKKLKEHFGVEE